MGAGLGRLVAVVLLAGVGFGCTALQASRLYARGTRALDRGEVAEAITALEHAAALAPYASEVRNHLGLAYLEAGRVREARAAFRSAVALDCDNQAARANLRALEGSVPAAGP